MIKENKIYNIIIYGNGLSAKTAVASFSHQGFKPIWVNRIKKEKYEDDRTTMLSPKSIEFYRKLNLDKLSKDIFPMFLLFTPGNVFGVIPLIYDPIRQAWY